MIHVGEGWLWPHVTSLYRSKKKKNWQQLVKCAVVDLHRNGNFGDFHWEMYLLNSKWPYMVVVFFFVGG